MKKILVMAFVVLHFALASAPASAKSKKSKKPAATMQALPPKVVIYDAATPAGPAGFALAAAEELKIPDAPLMTVTTDKEAGKGVVEEKSIGIEKGKTK